MIKKNLLAAMAIVFTMGMTMTSFAAGGWAQDNGGWRHYDANGQAEANVWRKGNDDKWRYVDYNGYMAVSTWIDEIYYVNDEGIMLADTWQKFIDGDGEHWCYFGSSGKKVESNWKKINDRWYYFDENGYMQTGWILDGMYYCGDDGAMKTGWQKLLPYDESSEEMTPGPDTESDDGMYWYYFTSGGKKFVPEGTSSGYIEKKINSKTYCFNDLGQMQIGWVAVKEDEGISGYRYYNNDGTIRTGWYSLEPPTGLSSNYDADVYWFYFNSQGIPQADKDGILTPGDIIKINGKQYLFDSNGNPVHGLVKLHAKDDSETYYYYFGTENQCTLQKGKLSVTDEAGSKNTYYFSTDGKGLTGLKDGYLYYKGLLQTSDTQSRYTAITVTEGNFKGSYLVSTMGKIVKNKKVKDADGVSYTMNASGIITKVDDEDVGGRTFNKPTEPYID